MKFQLTIKNRLNEYIEVNKLNLKEKILSKSDSYNFYKNSYKSLSKKNKKLEKKAKKLEKKNKKKEKKIAKLNKNLRKKEKELDFAQSQANLTLKEKFDKEYTSFSYFCRPEQLDYYLDDNFEDNLKEVTQYLDPEERYAFKFLYLRSLFVNFIRRDNYYTEKEVELQNEFTEFRKNHIDGNEIGEFEFTGDYNLHPFLGFCLDDASLEFLKDKDIIDAGAFTGDTSLPLSKLTNANVYAFEPFDESFEVLNQNIKNNNITNIIPVKKSLGNIDGIRSLYLSGNKVQGITSDADFREYDVEFKVNETKVDTFVEENDLNVGFIIVDIEGAELDLLDGAKNTIMTQKPILTISIYHRLKDFVEIIPWIANLDLGYEFKILRESPWSFISDTSVLCIPKEYMK
ncbi:hypothetical protein MBBTH_00630 [Methanobrevibacter thaueri]|uniref:Methyltransferase FkbM domain-containing protein n=1 Tax=Methanobrevibacter thaueri TaxID=190975 RepID=A0A315YCJ7_9EURY|nr:hypothetical protein MBBTH_00630 [Methanobrevibacter thaueri]